MEGFLRYQFGGPRLFWRGLFSEFYGMLHLSSFLETYYTQFLFLFFILGRV